MFEQKKIGFIGPGVMAEAIIAGLLREGVAAAESMLASGPRAERCEELSQHYGIFTTTDNTTVAKQSDVLVLSVKPQRLEKVLEGIRGLMKPTSLVLSIVAGAQIAKISNLLGHKLIIRSMPNTPAQIGEGITVWTAAPLVEDEHKEMARKILSALGEEIYVEEEHYLDKILLDALENTGKSGHITFEDPDVIITVETIAQWAGLSLWSREELQKYPFIRLD